MLICCVLIYFKFRDNVTEMMLSFSSPRSVSMGDMINEEEVGYLPPMSQSRHERMHEQYNSFLEDEEHWQDVRALCQPTEKKKEKCTFE